MAISTVSDATLGAATSSWSAVLTTIATQPTRMMSFGALFAALLIALVHFYRTYRRASGRRKRPTARRLLSMVFPKRLLRRKTNLFDALMFILNHKVTGLAIVWMVVSYHAISTTVNASLTSFAGPMAPTSLDPWVVTLIMTVTLYLAYEFAYWLDHYLCHTIPFLWEFHRVHHEAEVLTPLTNNRVHPVDTLVFANITAIVTGLVNGVMTFGFGQKAAELTFFDANAILVVASFLVVQLQHSHVWIPFTGVWGRLLMSPAHHQIHHSTNPLHYNKNMGSCLSVFDWMFGTLHMPEKKRERITFGIGDGEVTEHTVSQELMRPVTALAGEARRIAAMVVDRRTAG